jgi:hypothetical protein
VVALLQQARAATTELEHTAHTDAATKTCWFLLCCSSRRASAALTSWGKHKHSLLASPRQKVNLRLAFIFVEKTLQGKHAEINRGARFLRVSIFLTSHFYGLEEGSLLCQLLCDCCYCITVLLQQLLLLLLLLVSP